MFDYFWYQKCHLPEPGHCLKYEHVEPIALLPVKKSNGQVVYEQLEANTQKTGVPIEIIGDFGSDLKSGIEQYCQAHPKTSYIYDIKHKTAALLKRELKNNSLFQDFIEFVTKTKKQVQQTPLAGFAPPNQRTKARYMNVDILVNWGKNILFFLDKQIETPNPNFDQKIIQEKLGWVTQFRESLFAWEELLFVINRTENFVKKQGIYYNCVMDLSFILPFVSKRDKTNQFIIELLYFVNQESMKSPKRLLGSSEILESSFGKQKQLEKEQAKSGFTGLILGIAAFVSTTTNEVVQKALETVSTRDVMIWCKETLGQSVQALRNEIFAAARSRSE